MWQSFLWNMVFFFIKMALDVGNDFMDKTVAEVKAANTSAHEDGTPLTGNEKYEAVLNTMLGFAKTYNWDDKERSTVNTVIELAVGYVKAVVPKA